METMLLSYTQQRMSPMVSYKATPIPSFTKETSVADEAPVIDPADCHHAVNTLKELLAFWLMVSREAPDRGMGHSFVQEAIEVLKTAETKYGTGVREND